MFEYSSIEHYHAQLQEGNVTCLQAVEHYLQQISLSHHLNAFIEVYAEEARARARQLDENRKAGSLPGKLEIKDSECQRILKILKANEADLSY